MTGEVQNPIRVAFDRTARRLDAALAERLREEGFSRSTLRRWIEERRVTLNGSPSKPSCPVSPGDEAVIVPPPAGVPPRSSDLPLEVLYEDDDCLVIDKPAGMVTHPSKGHPDGTLVNALLGAGFALSKGSAPDRPGILHRLDKETSGALLVAKNDRAHTLLASQFSERTIRKTYLAIVWGALSESPLRVEAPMGRHPTRRTRMAVVQGGREATTTFRTIEILPHISLVEARPRTGRTHQIRVHLSHVHHPVVGDLVYGGASQRGLPVRALRKRLESLQRFFLHAHRIEFVSPSMGAVVVESPKPLEFRDILEEFRNHG